MRQAAVKCALIALALALAPSVDGRAHAADVIDDYGERFRDPDDRPAYRPHAVESAPIERHGGALYADPLPPRLDETPRPPAPVGRADSGAPALGAIRVVNTRDIGLSRVTIIARDAEEGESARRRVVARNVPPDSSVVVRYAPNEACVYDVHSLYEDGSRIDQEAVTFCGRASVRLHE